MIGPEHPFPVGEALLVGDCGIGGAARAQVGGRQAVPGAQGAGVIVAQDPASGVEQALPV